MTSIHSTATEVSGDVDYCAHQVAAEAARQLSITAAYQAKDVVTVYNEVYNGVAKRPKAAHQDVFQIRADSDGIVWLQYENGMLSLNDVALNLGPITGGALQAAIRKLVD